MKTSETVKATKLRNKTKAQPSRPERKYHQALDRLAGLLQSERFWTAREISKRTKISRIQVYRRLEALDARGWRLSWTMLRERQTGPLSKAYRIL